MIEPAISRLSREDLEKLADGLIGINTGIDPFGLATECLVELSSDIMKPGKAENAVFANEFILKLGKELFQRKVESN